MTGPKLTFSLPIFKHLRGDLQFTGLSGINWVSLKCPCNHKHQSTKRKTDRDERRHSKNRLKAHISISIFFLAFIQASPRRSPFYRSLQWRLRGMMGQTLPHCFINFTKSLKSQSKHQSSR